MNRFLSKLSQVISQKTSLITFVCGIFTINSIGQTLSNNYVHFDFSTGTGSTLVSTGVPYSFPSINLNGNTSNLWSVPSKIHIDANGNPSTRIYGNLNIDDMMRLDDLNSSNKCKFFAVTISRHTLTTPLTSNERIFQYGDQGSSTGETGGWVARINHGNTAPFLNKSISFAIHTPDIGTPKPGGQSDPNFPDPIATTAVLSDAEWEAGVCLLFGVDNSVTPYRARIYINGVLIVSDVQSDLTWPLPAVSNNGPGSNSSSNGFVLFAQSTNEGTAPLKDADVGDIWLGRCANTTELDSIAILLCNDNLSSINEPDESTNEITFYPNPTFGTVHINTSNSKIKSIKLFNMQGQLIQEYFTNDFFVSNLTDGVYFIRVETDNLILTKKLIKQ